MAYWLVAFDSTHHALRAEAELEGAGLEIDIRPTPKSVTAGCALAIDFEPDDFDAVRAIIEDREIVVRGYFKPQGEGYELLQA
ncbi:DUF3343 domain-containing protein [Tumebacillus flagellatus]|uniref:Putative Se/S carrier protein-like domain-containing protein n=1 Tax=Tumebacillus flagellatus TaxID=1157490 RepID=A0A074LG56_9BACL|nr:DUF3343 domain-containing protein [Tumebacillus flagellatus]KEO81206.1 hypothetical protein EL26_21970 [Tumebacillus flagellatus]